MPKLVVPPPEPKEVVDSIGDGVVEVLQVGSRFIEKQGNLTREIGDGLMEIGEDVKADMFDKPEVLAKAAVGVVGSGVGLIFGTVGNVAAALSETASGVKKQASRVTK